MDYDEDRRAQERTAMRTAPFRRDDGKFGVGENATAMASDSSKVDQKRPSGSGKAWNKGGAKVPGSGRKMGTPNGSTREVMELCAKYHWNPIEAMIVVAMDEETRLDIRVKCMDAVASRIYPSRGHVDVDVGDRSAEIMRRLLGGRDRVAKLETQGTLSPASAICACGHLRPCHDAAGCSECACQGFHAPKE